MLFGLKRKGTNRQGSLVNRESNDIIIDIREERKRKAESCRVVVASIFTRWRVSFNLIQSSFQMSRMVPAKMAKMAVGKEKEDKGYERGVPCT